MGDVKGYTRIVGTDGGGSRFEDAELQLTEQQVAEGGAAHGRGQLGHLVLVTDTTGTGHVTVAVGDPPLEALFVPEA